jgi:hypothetical protein
LPAKTAPIAASAALPTVVEAADERLNVVKLRPNQSALPADAPKEVFALEDAIHQVPNESKDKSKTKDGTKAEDCRCPTGAPEPPHSTSDRRVGDDLARCATQRPCAIAEGTIGAKQTI